MRTVLVILALTYVAIAAGASFFLRIPIR